MRAGRVESYIHSDSITEHKGGVLFLVTCRSDAAANTDEFKAFCRAIGPLVYAMSTVDGEFFKEDVTPLEKMCTAFPDVVDVIKDVQGALKEKVDLAEIHWITL